MPGTAFNLTRTAATITGPALARAGPGRSAESSSPCLLGSPRRRDG